MIGIKFAVDCRTGRNELFANFLRRCCKNFFFRPGFSRTLLRCIVRNVIACKFRSDRLFPRYRLFFLKEKPCNPGDDRNCVPERQHHPCSRKNGSILEHKKFAVRKKLISCEYVEVVSFRAVVQFKIQDWKKVCRQKRVEYRRKFLHAFMKFKFKCLVFFHFREFSVI